jgi:AraC-like DNA-binding protein
MPHEDRREAPEVPFVVEELDGGEQRASFRVGDSWCRMRKLDLRGGVSLSVTACQLEPSFAFSALQQPAELELVVSKGAALAVRTPDGRELQRGGNTVQLGRTRRPAPLRVHATGDTPMECVSVAMSVARLHELLGTRELPEVFRRVADAVEHHPLVTQVVTPRLLRLLDEIANTGMRTPVHRLWYEAKSLELIAMVTDDLVESHRATELRLSAYEFEQLERARRRLVARLDTPPTLAQLARTAGLSETRLKAGFRMRFGTSVFAYLRRARMEEARRLLGEGDFNVSEVAQRIGYANSSKFAAAFRREFGKAPSAI